MYRRYFSGTHRRHLTRQASIYPLHVRHSCWMWATSSEQGEVFSRTERSRNGESVYELRTTGTREKSTNNLKDRRTGSHHWEVSHNKGQGWADWREKGWSRPNLWECHWSSQALGLNQNSTVMQIALQCLNRLHRKRGCNREGKTKQNKTRLFS